ncbi:LiaF transmembrane domain-containing protein [Paenibacillus sp. FA6]|uniref:LiaF transmembrane domain-containing protein n=1 Tax=Paenibacillus sp. FA6 TaxID=3413029 RepID=UPI003F65779C
MDLKRRNGLAAVLIIIGALMLLGVFGPLLGRLLGLVFPIILIALGYYGVRSGKVLIGWIILAIGILSLIAKLSWLIGPILGIVVLVFGISLLRNKRRTY